MSTLSLLFSSRQFPDVRRQFCSVQIRTLAVTLRPLRSGLILCLFLPYSPRRSPQLPGTLGVLACLWASPHALSSTCDVLPSLPLSPFSSSRSPVSFRSPPQRGLLRRDPELSGIPTTTTSPICLHDRAPRCPLLACISICHICFLITYGLSASPAGMPATSG